MTTTTESPAAGQLPIPAALENLVPAGRARLTQRWMLVFAAFICLVVAVTLTRTAIEQLNSSTPLTGDAAPGVGAGTKLVDAIVSTALMILFVGAAIVSTELALPQPLGLLSGVGNRRFFGGLAGATAGYIAIVFFNGELAAKIVTASPYPGSSTVGAGMLGRDFADSIAAGFIEELLLFAIPLALLGIWATRRGIKWAGLALVIALRFGIHLCYGPGFAAVLVVPWIIAAWLLYRAMGTIWPLIIGHALYDAAVFTMMRTKQAWVSPALSIIATIGGLLLLATVMRWGIIRGRRRPRRTSAGQTSLGEMVDARNAVKPGQMGACRQELPAQIRHSIRSSSATLVPLKVVGYPMLAGTMPNWSHRRTRHHRLSVLNRRLRAIAYQRREPWSRWHGLLWQSCSWWPR